MEKLAKATGGKIVSTFDELSADDLGYAGFVEERKLAGEEMTFVRECKDPRSVSILVRGSTEHVTDEAKRAMDDAVLGVISAIEVGRVVAGGGAAELELSRKLREFAQSQHGREQLAINAFADAIEVIPRTLAESTGKDPIDLLAELRSHHDKGKANYGIDVLNGVAADMKAMGVIEPLKIKTQAIISATEATDMILRIDDVITAKSGGGMPGGGMGGMPPGMGGMDMD